MARQQLDPVPATGGEPTSPPAPARRRPRGLASWATEFAMVGVLIVVVIVAQILESKFLNGSNLSNIITQNAQVGLVAIGMTFVLIGGGFDLSVGGIFALAGILYAHFANVLPVGLAFLLMLVIAVAIGVGNGLVITRLHVNAFVATLGSASIFSGLAFLIAANGAIFVEKPSFFWLGTHSLLGIRVTIWILALAFLVGGFVLAKTVYGRAVYTVGGNAEAARLSGMRVGLIQASTYVLAALGAVVGGMLLASETQVGQANVGGEVTLDAIAVVIIGGTSLYGGRGAMWRTLIGLLIIASITNLLQLMAVNSSIQSVAKGAIVILAVAFDAWTQRRRRTA
jgi:ribose transport system permease protein